MNVSAVESAGSAASPRPAPPNIVLIMADQLVPMLTGAYGHPVVQTPNLDALVRAGVRFDAASSPSPLCAPRYWSASTRRPSSATCGAAWGRGA